MKPTNKKQRLDKIVLFLVAVILLIAASPFLIGLLRQQPGYIYTGLNGELWADQLVYFSWINQAREGAWLFKNLFTNESQQPSFFHPLWFVLGKAANLFSLSTPVVFHLARLFFVGAFLLIIYFFIGNLVIKKWIRLLTLAVIGLGAGWGWLFYVFDLSRGLVSKNVIASIFPVDIYWAEFFALRAFWHSPLTILSQLLLVLIFWRFLVNYRNFSWLRFVIIGCLISFLVLIHPYDIFTVFGVLFIFFVIRFLQDRQLEWRLWLQIIGWGLFVIPVVVYFFWLFITQPAFVGWWQQNVPFDRTYFAYFLGYGWLLILPWFYLSYFFRQKNIYCTLVLAWYLWGVMIIFFDLSFAVRWLNGWQIPASILTVLSIVKLLDEIGVKPKKKLIRHWSPVIVLFIFLCSFLPSSFLGWYKIIKELDGKTPPYYQSIDFWQGIGSVKELPRDVVILSTPRTGLFIAAWSLHPTFISHPHQSGHYNRKLSEVTKFFIGYDPGYFKPRLKNWGIKYFAYSDYDKEVASFNPAKWWPWPEVININGNFIVYQVED